MLNLLPFYAIIYRSYKLIIIYHFQKQSVFLSHPVITSVQVITRDYRRGAPDISRDMVKSGPSFVAAAAAAESSQ